MLEDIFNCEGCRRRREKMKRYYEIGKSRVAEIIGRATKTVAGDQAPAAPEGKSMDRTDDGNGQGSGEAAEVKQKQVKGSDNA